MAWLIPVLLIASAVGLVVWPSISQAFMPPGGMAAPPGNLTYFNPAPGDKITVLNARPGATDPNVGFSIAVQEEFARRFSDYGYLVGVFPEAPVSVNQPGMVGTLGQFMVLPASSGQITGVAIPSDLGASTGRGEPGLFVVGLEQSPATRGQAAAPMGGGMGGMGGGMAGMPGMRPA